MSFKCNNIGTTCTNKDKISASEKKDTNNKENGSNNNVNARDGVDENDMSTNKNRKNKKIP